MNQDHYRKMIAPIIIAVAFVIYYGGFFIVCAILELPILLKLLFGLIPIVLAGVCIYVLIERIREIRSGEEDDLSQY